MAPGTRSQFKLIACHLAGVVAAGASLPYLLATGLDLRSVVTSLLGFAAFLALATVGGFLWRHLIEAWPVRSAIAMPVVLAAAIYLLLRVSSGFAADEAWLASETALMGGLSALFSAMIFLLWTSLSGGLQSPS